MKRVLIILFCLILVSGLVVAIPLTGSSVQNQENNAAGGPIKYGECGDNICDQGENAPSYPYYCPEDCVGQEGTKLKETQRLRIKNSTGECTESCECSGSTTKCQFRNGTRTMTINAGNSGNIIVQVKNQNASTKVTLYKSGEKVYGEFKNQTKRIILPDQIREKIQQRLQSQNCSCDMTLNEEGVYQVRTQKQARILGLFKVRKRFTYEYNATTGEMIRERTSWWSGFAKEIEEEPIIGSSCGTVSPDSRDECCQNKDYDYWDQELSECLILQEEVETSEECGEEGESLPVLSEIECCEGLILVQNCNPEIEECPLGSKGVCTAN